MNALQAGQKASAAAAGGVGGCVCVAAQRPGKGAGRHGVPATGCANGAAARDEHRPLGAHAMAQPRGTWGKNKKNV